MNAIVDPRKWNVPATLVGTLLVGSVGLTMMYAAIRSDLSGIEGNTGLIKTVTAEVDDHDERLRTLETNEAVDRALMIELNKNIERLLRRTELAP